MNNKSIDIACLQETHLTQNQQIKSLGYTILRKDRSSERKGGGVALLINNKIQFCGINFPDFVNDVDTIGISVWLNNTKTYIISFYNANGQTTDAMDFFSYISNPNMLKNIIICGDINAHSLLWGNKPANKAGKFIECSISNNNELAVATPPNLNTYFNPNRVAVSLQPIYKSCH
jgi:exonuclease III